MALHPTPYFTDGDTERARELFEEGLCLSGYTRSTLPKIILCYSPSERNSKIAQLVQEQWQRAFGVPISLQSIDRQMYRLWFNQGRCQIGMGDWVADFHDPLAFLELFKYPNDPQTGSGLNPTGWQDPHFINLLNLSLVERDPQRRQELLHDAEKLLVAQMPIAPLYHYAFDYIKKEYVQGVTLSPLGLADFKQARISR
jgi:oligopeptide transport system substrate-binding protein